MPLPEPPPVVLMKEFRRKPFSGLSSAQRRSIVLYLYACQLQRVEYVPRVTGVQLVLVEQRLLGQLRAAMSVIVRLEHVCDCLWTKGILARGIVKWMNAGDAEDLRN